eukprot:TRINITY_DN6255_c0_g1_i1.p1 TRINITY_DN6255_c0_g1~~TRINITY_DN6255_c0_g1_i1.p1  ORF type:complete len:227 (+),score=77.12 TRINITY_DN6255_c0_g1_i1:81-761(+)
MSFSLALDREAQPGQRALDTELMRRRIIDRYMELEAQRNQLPTQVEKDASAADGTLDVGPKLPSREECAAEHAATLAQLEKLFQRTYAVDAEIATAGLRARQLQERLETEKLTKRTRAELEARRDLTLQQQELLGDRLESLCSFVESRLSELTAACPRDPLREIMQRREERRERERLRRENHPRGRDNRLREVKRQRPPMPGFPGGPPVQTERAPHSAASAAGSVR